MVIVGFQTNKMRARVYVYVRENFVAMRVCTSVD